VGLTAAGGTFTFTSDKGSMTANVTGVSVETGTAKMANMSSSTEGAHVNVLVPTGEYEGGSIRVDYLRYSGQVDPNSLIGGVGSAAFASQGFSVSKNVVLQNASEEAQFGDLVRGSLSFLWTDYTPS
jgi:hypothetical protein